MFERFTDRARRAVVLAQEEARLLVHNYIGTEHLLLGLISESEGVAARSLHAVGLTLDDVRAEVVERVGKGSEAARGHIPFTPRAKKVLELSLRQAIKLDHDYIGTEHILLGVLEEGQGVAALIVLAKADGGLERVQSEIFARLVEAGSLSRGHKALAEMRQRMSAARASVSVGADEEIIRRLDAIEARLAEIERLLGGGGEALG